MSPKTACCMQRGPNWVAGRTPVQFFTGCGAFHRESPTGGAANGTPLNARTPVAWGPDPSSVPFAILTRSAANSPAAIIIRQIGRISGRLYQRARDRAPEAAG